MSDKKNLQEKLLDVQLALKAPKSQYNSFGNYRYRTAEDIVEAFKPLAKKCRLLLTISDDIVAVGDRIYIKATATITDIDDPDKTIACDAYAREPAEKKKMDDSQITGAASSYARKYALNGLFSIDDTKDADSTNQGANGQNRAEEPASPTEVQCADCGAIIRDTGTHSVADIVKLGNERFGRVLCAPCARKAQEGTNEQGNNDGQTGEHAGA